MTNPHGPVEGLPRAAPGGLAGMRVVDGRTGRLVDLSSARSGLLRVSVDLPCAGGVVSPTDLRALVTADVLQRMVEMDGLQMFHVLAVPGLSTELAKILDRAVTALDVHPPLDTVPVDQVASALGGGPDVHVVTDAAGYRGLPTGLWILVGRVDDEAVAVQDRPTVHGLADGGTDPSALRLALLARPHGEPVVLDPATLVAAGRSVQAWRGRVAEWARSPSQPVPERLRREIRAAFTEDLDTPAALALLEGVEVAEGLADGARFETFALVDRVLGLELTRDVGRG